MITETQAQRKSVLTNPLVYSSLLLLIVAGYVGWIMLSRHHENRSYEKRTAEAQAKRQREQDLVAIEQLGGKDLAIQMLYATPRIRRGETAQVCFGVAHAKTITQQVTVEVH